MGKSELWPFPDILLPTKHLLPPHGHVFHYHGKMLGLAQASHPCIILFLPCHFSQSSLGPLRGCRSGWSWPTSSSLTISGLTDPLLLWKTLSRQLFFSIRLRVTYTRCPQGTWKSRYPEPHLLSELESRGWGQGICICNAPYRTILRDTLNLTPDHLLSLTVCAKLAGLKHNAVPVIVPYIWQGLIMVIDDEMIGG